MDILLIPVAIIFEIANNVNWWLVLGVILIWRIIFFTAVYLDSRDRMIRTLESIDSKLDSVVSNLECIEQNTESY